MDMAEDDMTMPDPRVDQMAYYRWMLKRLQYLAEAYPGAEETVRPMIEYRERQIAELEAIDAAIEAVEQAPTGRVTMGYQKSATGAMQPRPVVLGSEHRTRTNRRDA